MRKLLVCQHVPYEVLGTLDAQFRRHGFRIRYVNFARYPRAEPQLKGYRGLVVLGGPMNVDEVEAHPHLRTEVCLIREAIARGIPVLGICLGAQLIARALGARVHAGGAAEIGWCRVHTMPAAKADPLFSHFGSAEFVFQWHRDAFEWPPGSVPLATSATCGQQAFRYGDNVYALQFHLEVDERLVDRWLRVPARRAELERLAKAVDPEAIRRETAVHIHRLKALSHAVFGAFIGLFGLPAKRHALPSR